MCGWTLKPISAASPARASSLAKPDGVNGLPRSEAKTKGEADWRLSSLSARNSSPSRGCVASCPPLARHTLESAGLELDRRPLKAAELRHLRSVTETPATAPARGSAAGQSTGSENPSGRIWFRRLVVWLVVPDCYCDRDRSTRFAGYGI